MMRMMRYASLLLGMVLIISITTGLTGQSLPLSDGGISPQSPSVPEWMISANRQMSHIRRQINYWWEPDVPELAHLADAAALRYGIEPKLFRALIYSESAWQVDAVSAKGAIGLAQLLPTTARSECGLQREELTEPKKNLACGARYLAKQIKKFGLPKALCAYNAGPKLISRLGTCPDYPETQRYVNRVMNRWGQDGAT